jgi:hypothetical protein
VDIITYALSKKIAAYALSGVADMSVDGQTLNIDTNDGKRLQVTFPTPKDGLSITDVDVDENNHLVCTLSDGSTITSVHSIEGFNENSGSSELERDIICNVSVGNAGAGTTLPRGMSFTEYAERVHVATLPPSVVINEPTAMTKEYGEVITTLPIKATITKKTYNLSKADFYDNNTNINTIVGIPTNGVVSMGYTCNNNDRDMKIKVVATDAGGLQGSASVDIKYSRGIFYGTSTTGTLYNTSALVRSLGNKLLGKGKGDTFTIDIPVGTKTVVIAIPATMSLADVKFEESMNMGVLSTFNVSNVDVEGANGYTAIGYKVYQYIAPTSFSQLSHYNVTV